MNEELLKTLGLLILALPAGAAVLAGALGGRWLKGATHWPVVFGVGGAGAAALLLFGQVGTAPPGRSVVHPVVYQWISPAARSWFNVEFWIDPLTAIMLVTVTFVAFLVVIYSRDYMRHHGRPERGYERFFAFLALFVFSMCALVLGGNFLMLYFGWEAVGLCSYLLIGFYYQRPAAAAAAKKAFLVNRIGDFGFGLGVLLIYFTFGRLDYATVFRATELVLAGDYHSIAQMGRLLGLAPDAAQLQAAVIFGRLPIIALLLFCGAVGKSAQFPLYVWLPDAMEGPSPVSALIHAATMVTAGVYMVVRCGVIFAASETVMTLVAVVGAGTALFAATIALTQTDMKRILAYSTISQLGYMFLGMGVFAASSAVFHLFTHAFFKALLFLGAGSVMHALGGVIDVRRFSGLRRALPVTAATMVIGAAALAGLPLLSGFWSKDEIIHHAFAAHPALGVVGLLTAGLTALYTFRMVFLAFWGPERAPQGVHVHESGDWMLVSLCVLAIGAVGAGYVGVHVQAGGFAGFLEPGGAFHRFIEPAVRAFAERAPELGTPAGQSAAGHGFFAAVGHHWLMYLSALIALGGTILAYVGYVRCPGLPERLRDACPRVHRVLLDKYYVDEAYAAAVVEPLRRSGRWCFGIDEYVIDGLIWLVTAIPRLAGFVSRSLQGGAIQGYGLSMIGGLAVMLALMLLR